MRETQKKDDGIRAQAGEVMRITMGLCDGINTKQMLAMLILC